MSPHPHLDNVMGLDGLCDIMNSDGVNKVPADDNGRLLHTEAPQRKELYLPGEKGLIEYENR